MIENEEGKMRLVAHGALAETYLNSTPPPSKRAPHQFSNASSRPECFVLAVFTAEPQYNAGREDGVGTQLKLHPSRFFATRVHVAMFEVVFSLGRRRKRLDYQRGL